MTLLTRATTAAVYRPWLALLVATTIVAALAWPSAQLQTDNSLAVWFVEDDPSLVRYRAFLSEFGNDEAVVVAYRAPESAWSEAGHVNPAEWALQREAVERVSAVDGVERVLSGAALMDLLGPAAAGRLPALGLSGDSGVVALVAWLEARPDMDARRGRILDDVESALDATLGAAGREVRLAGTGVLYEGLNRQTERDAALFLGLAVGVMALLLRLVLGSWAAVAIALVAPIAATVATMGVVAWSGRSMNMVMATLPALILVIGLADAVHIFIEWFRARRDRPPANVSERRALAAQVVARMAVPCLFTSVTTALAFLALTSSRMAVIQELGVFAAVGVLVVWALVVVATGVGLSLLDIRPPTRALGARLGRRLVRLAAWVSLHRRAVIVGSALAGVVLLAGATRIVVDTHTIGLLPSDHRVVQDSRWIEANLGLYTPLEFMVEARDGTVLSGDLLQGIRRWRDTAEAMPGVDRTLGVAELLALPGSGMAIEGADVSAYLTADGRRTRVTAFVPMGTAREFAATARALEAEGVAALGDLARVTATGYLPLYVRIIDYTVSSTILGLALAFLGVFVALGLLFRSARPVLAAVPPNLLAVAVVFGVMGWSRIPLDIATATVGAIVIGIGVDDTVHFLHRYRAAIHRGESDPASAAMVDAGPAMILSSVVLVMGLAVLLAAGSLSIVYFGVLTSIAISAALVADLVLLPALLGGRRT
jgi:uncharacterized protein